MTTIDHDERHEQGVRIITQATAKLLEQFRPNGFTPEMVCEGCAKGGVVALMVGTGCTLDEAADCLEGIAAGLRLQPGEADPTQGTKH